MGSFTKALRAKRDAEKSAQPKPHYRYNWRLGRPVLVGPKLVLTPKKPASNVHQLVKYDRQPVVVGGKCHHCHPNRPGRWVNPATGAVGKCFVCNGMGIISERDRAFDDARRRGERGPLCDVRSA